MDEARNPMASLGPGSFPPGPNGSLGPMGVSMPAPGADNVLPKAPWRFFSFCVFRLASVRGFGGMFKV